MNTIFKIIVLLSCVFFLSSCEKYFGDKTNLDFIELPTQNYREVAYVPVQPILDQFVRPTDVLAGFDELIYVVDNGTEEIIALDQSGREVGRKSVPGVISVTQDRRLDLLAIGTKDTVLSGTPYKLTTIYRIDISTPLGYGLKFGRITNTITHPFYIKLSGFVTNDAAVSFNRIAVMGDNSYYVTRQGPVNSSTGVRTPDDAILLFDENDRYITPISITANDGRLFKDYFKNHMGSPPIQSLLKLQLQIIETLFFFTR